jgi:hypothetical protein
VAALDSHIPGIGLPPLSRLRRQLPSRGALSKFTDSFLPYNILNLFQKVNRIFYFLPGILALGSQAVESKKISKKFTETPLPKVENQDIVYPNNDNKEKLRRYYGQRKEEQ